MTVPGWQTEGTTLKRQFKFKDFKAAWQFMNQVAAVAEELDHHPDWSNSYNQVEIELTTHSAGELTEKDAQLAQRINQIWSDKS